MRRIVHGLPFTALVAALAAACGSDAAAPRAGEVPDRAVFIATYVDLRVAALTSEAGEITDEARAAVLQEHGVNEEQLYAFVEYHGENLDFMRDVWNEVEVLLEAQRPSRDEAR